MVNIIQITEQSAKQIQKIRQNDNIPDDKLLRVSVVGGGCSGFSYKLSFDSEKREDDIIVAEHDVQLYVDAKSALYLSGTTLDYSGGLNGKGFEFTNPNAVRTCGCGSSFAIQRNKDILVSLDFENLTNLYNLKIIQIYTSLIHPMYNGILS